jgi:hypothetical protein
MIGYVFFILGILLALLSLWPILAYTLWSRFLEKEGEILDTGVIVYAEKFYRPIVVYKYNLRDGEVMSHRWVTVEGTLKTEREANKLTEKYKQESKVIVKVVPFAQKVSLLERSKESLWIGLFFCVIGCLVALFGLINT